MNAICVEAYEINGEGSMLYSRSYPYNEANGNYDGYAEELAYSADFQNAFRSCMIADFGLVPECSFGGFLYYSSDVAHGMAHRLND